MQKKKKKKIKTLIEREVYTPGKAKQSKINNVSGNGISCGLISNCSLRIY